MDIGIDFEMITTVNLDYSFFFFLVKRTFKIYSLNFEICSIPLLTIVTMLYITSPGLTYLIIEVCTF